MNTPPAVLEDIQTAVSNFYKNQIVGGSEFSDLEWLEGQAAAFVNQERDEKDFEKRIKRLSKRKVAKYKGAEIVEPSNEVGVLTVVNTIATVDPAAFPFRLLDYTTYRGYDALATLGRDDLPLEKLSMAYIEFKYGLGSTFNHLFKHLAGIVCWETDLKDMDEVTDVGDNRRKLVIVPGNLQKKEHTRYWLEADRSRNKIEIFVLKEYLNERLAIRFEPRSTD